MAMSYNQFQDHTITVTGGTAPYTVSIVNNTGITQALFPTGISFNTSDFHLTGTPSDTSTYTRNRTVHVVDSTGATFDQDFTINYTGRRDFSITSGSISNTATLNLNTPTTVTYTVQNIDLLGVLYFTDPLSSAAHFDNELSFTQISSTQISVDLPGGYSYASDQGFDPDGPATATIYWSYNDTDPRVGQVFGSFGRYVYNFPPA